MMELHPVQFGKVSASQMSIAANHYGMMKLHAGESERQSELSLGALHQNRGTAMLNHAGKSEDHYNAALKHSGKGRRTIGVATVGEKGYMTHDDRVNNFRNAAIQ